MSELTEPCLRAADTAALCLVERRRRQSTARGRPAPECAELTERGGAAAPGAPEHKPGLKLRRSAENQAREAAAKEPTLAGGPPGARGQGPEPEDSRREAEAGTRPEGLWEARRAECDIESAWGDRTGPIDRLQRISGGSTPLRAFAFCFTSTARGTVRGLLKGRSADGHSKRTPREEKDPQSIEALDEPLWEHGRSGRAD
ncbi:hypothetical protein NDU88_006725 [Pleurodeles waltl]|uniref:Uncharacterized protein n=1 Tax=Pleurodeles waltl TaxID=8319 RepID=A0AAV7TY05_PLEWA|nr:hypothetical protein NDU88_006725 [Pleurodeles waltl]